MNAESRRKRKKNGKAASYYSKRRDRLWAYGLKRRFGITLEQYLAMHTAQNGLCAICGKQERRKHRGQFSRLAVDRKGGDLEEWPTDLRVRLFPEAQN